MIGEEAPQGQRSGAASLPPPPPGMCHPERVPSCCWLPAWHRLLCSELLHGWPYKHRALTQTNSVDGAPGACGLCVLGGRYMGKGVGRTS